MNENEIIRCKDCKHYIACEIPDLYQRGMSGFCEEIIVLPNDKQPKPDDFCSRAERKD